MAFVGYSHCGEASLDPSCTMKFPNSIPEDLEAQARYRRRMGIQFCPNHGRGKRNNSWHTYDLQWNLTHSTAFPEVQRLYESVMA
ncbi:MAG: hypothetical protein V1740_03405 [Candidatus Woesearchaeota archaeon]